MIVPLMIWSARTVIDSQAWTREMTIPTATAASNATIIGALMPKASTGKDPSSGTARAPTYQPTNAATSMIPSMPMFTTPDRSQRTPHMAAKAIGVAPRRMNGAMDGKMSTT